MYKYIYFNLKATHYIFRYKRLLIKATLQPGLCLKENWWKVQPFFQKFMGGTPLQAKIC